MSEIGHGADTNHRVSVCPRCGEPTTGHRCHACGVGIRPVLLALLADFIILRLLLASFLLFAGWGGGSGLSMIILSVGVILNAGGIILFYGLRKGNYRAWKAAKTYLIFFYVPLNLIFCSILLPAIGGTMEYFAAFLLLESLAEILLTPLAYMYIRSNRVKSFCGVEHKAESSAD